MELPHFLLEMSALLTLAVLLGLVARRVGIPLSVILVVVGVVAAAAGLTPEIGRLEGEERPASAAPGASESLRRWLFSCSCPC